MILTEESIRDVKNKPGTEVFGDNTDVQDLPIGRTPNDNLCHI